MPYAIVTYWPAAMTFGMMFGSRQESLDEWSTDDDEEDDEYNDCDDDDDEYDDDDEDDEDDESFDLPLAAAAVESSSSYPWEPQAKQYSNMNLKDQVSMEKLQGDTMILKEVSCPHGDGDGRSNGVGLNDAGDTTDVGLNDAEKEKKMKLAKKRADKRRKQKERRLKEQTYPPPPPPPLGSLGTSAAAAAAPINYHTGKGSSSSYSYSSSSSSSSVYDPLSAAKEIDYTKESISLTKSSLIKLSADAGFNQQELKRWVGLSVCLSVCLPLLSYTIIVHLSMHACMKEMVSVHRV